MYLPHGIPPIVHRRALWKSFLETAWRQTQQECGITLYFTRDVTEIGSMDRGDAADLPAFDPTRSNSLTQYGLIAKEGNRVIMTFSSAIYALGDLDLRQYIEEIGLADGAAGEFKFLPESPAFFLATGVRNQFAFAGNVWVPQDQRGGRPRTRQLASQLGIIARIIHHGCFKCDHSVSFIREQHVKAGMATVHETRAPGAVYEDGASVWLNYSGQSFSECLAHAA